MVRRRCELRGFGVQVMTSGLKSFVLQYRSGGGRSRRLVIGRYGVMTVEEARKAKALLGQIAAGIDPAEKKDAPSETVTVVEICDWYPAEAGRILGRRRRRPIKPSTLAMDRSGLMCASIRLRSIFQSGSSRDVARWSNAEKNYRLFNRNPGGF